jgi:1,6-anhydro-N-acetylmuramate kinase
MIRPVRALHPAGTRPLALAAAALVLTLLGACAGTPPPVAQMAVAEASVKRAGSTSTTETAAAELRVATDKLAAARSALTAGDHDRARQLAEQATLDAQVAELHAQAARSVKAAQETQDAARVLRDEIARKAPR